MQDEARVTYWLLSRQCFTSQVLQCHAADLLSAVALGLVTSNKWESMQCVHYSLKCILKLSHQIAEGVRDTAHLWLPQLWRLLLVQPVTEYDLVCSTHCKHAVSSIAHSQQQHLCIRN